METKEKKVQEKITELCELMGDNDRFVIFRKSGNVVDIALPKSGMVTDEMVSSALAVVIESNILQKTDNEGVCRFSEIIIDAIEALIGVSPIASVKLTQRFTKAALLGMKMELDKLDEDDVDNESPCATCEDMRTCMEKDAVAYRKENGIPKPKKGKKGGRKVAVN